MIWPFKKPKVKDPEIARLRYENSKLTRQVDDANARANAEAMEAIRRGNDLTNMTAANAGLARQLAEACKERDEAHTKWKEIDHAETLLLGNVEALREVLAEIAELGAASKNGTARKLARMAREALE